VSDESERLRRAVDRLLDARQEADIVGDEA
jgi:hypothetical protein